MTLDLLEEGKNYPIKMLKQVFKEVGFPSSTMTIFRLEQKGILTFRRLPFNNRRVVTVSDIKGIIKALSPGGSGKWSYE